MGGRVWRVAAAMAWACLAVSAKGPLPALGLHVSRPYSASAPGQDVTLYLILRNRSDAPVAVSSLPPPSVEVEVAGRAVSLEGVTAADGEPEESARSEMVIPPGGHVIRPVVIRLDRTLFLPGDYPLRVTLDLPGRGPLAAEATLTVRYKSVFFY